MATIETHDIVVVDMLTKDSVSILTKTMATINNNEVQVGENHRCAYINSRKGREKLQQELSEPYLTSVLAVWGNTPTIEENIEEE